MSHHLRYVDILSLIADGDTEQEQGLTVLGYCSLSTHPDYFIDVTALV
jgi:hypothetical protein